MHEKADDAGTVSWKLFNDLYENQYDLFRKLRFIVKAGRLNNSESIALEMIDDYLKRKEGELKNLRQAGLEEWIRRGKGTALQRSPAGERFEDDGETGPDRSLIPMAPVSGLSIWSKVLSRMKGE